MIRETMAQFNMPWLPTIGMLLFLFVFLGSLFWVFRKDSRDFYSRLERLPLQEEGK